MYHLKGVSSVSSRCSEEKFDLSGCSRSIAMSVDHDLKRGSYAQCGVCRKYILEKSLKQFCCEACLDSPKARELMEKKRKSDTTKYLEKAQAKKKNKKKALWWYQRTKSR